MKAIEVPAIELYDVHITYDKPEGDEITVPVIHAGVKSRAINGKRIATGSLLSIFLPYIGGRAKFSVMGQREHPQHGHMVYFGFLIQE